MNKQTITNKLPNKQAIMNKLPTSPHLLKHVLTVRSRILRNPFKVDKMNDAKELTETTPTVEEEEEWEDFEEEEYVVIQPIDLRTYAISVGIHCLLYLFIIWSLLRIGARFDTVTCSLDNAPSVQGTFPPMATTNCSCPLTTSSFDYDFSSLIGASLE